MSMKPDTKKQMTRILCLVIAGIMIISVLAAALFSQVR